MQFCYIMHSHLQTVFFILSKSWARAFRKVKKSRQILNSKAFFLIFYSLNKLTKIDASKKRAINLINFPVFLPSTNGVPICRNWFSRFNYHRLLSDAFFYRVFMRLRPVKRLTLPVLKEQMKENEFHANQLLSKKVKGLNNKSIANYQPTRKESWSWNSNLHDLTLPPKIGP